MLGHVKKILHSIVGELLVRGKYRQFLRQRLGDNEAIKEIFMELRQIRKFRGMDEANREKFDTILPELVPEESLWRGWQAEFSVSQFDKNLPDSPC